MPRSGALIKAEAPSPRARRTRPADDLTVALARCLPRRSGRGRHHLCHRPVRDLSSGSGGFCRITCRSDSQPADPQSAGVARLADLVPVVFSYLRATRPADGLRPTLWGRSGGARLTAFLSGFHRLRHSGGVGGRLCHSPIDVMDLEHRSAAYARPGAFASVDGKPACAVGPARHRRPSRQRKQPRRCVSAVRGARSL